MTRGHAGGVRGVLFVGLVASVVASTTALASPVAAQAGPEPTEAELDRARAAFAEGVDATDEGRWDDAVARFREVMEVRATPQVKYNLAVALEQTGEYVGAQELLREVVDDPEIDRRTRREAQELLETVGPQAEEQRAEREAAAAAEVPSPQQAARESVVDEELLAPREEPDEGGSVLGEWWLWTGVGAVVLGAVLIGVVVASGGDGDPVRGNLEPGILRVSP